MSLSGSKTEENLKADFAGESARVAKAQVLQQSGAAMLAQANASSQLALSLIR